MPKPRLILDQHFRQVEELFSPTSYDELGQMCEIVGGQNWRMDRRKLEKALPGATFLVASKPELTSELITTAPNLKATIEVSGAFQAGLDYTACFDRGIEVLSCMPGFMYSVAEMALGMIVAGARGLVSEHENFRRRSENWLADNPLTDFTLYGQKVGFVGYGAIARETHRLLASFAPVVQAYDPWLSENEAGVPLVALEEVMTQNRVVVIAASPTAENEAMISAELVGKIRAGTLVVLISRAHCVDFPAMVAAAKTGQIRFATDVFPDEPILLDDPIRDLRNVILSPHRAAAVPGGRQPIGDMIVDDVRAILEGRPERKLKPANPAHVASLAAAVKPLKMLE
ncbi:NAD(P)-dependent oxidoreductase [Tropicimonas marinistellae]|uniref:NAD(P)-dependent oxidoreductase n=1 Tax=Tropicimonas marinistellae TaxID=1739787 RepID=UPI0008317DA7|nr:NAD(P)-dependent oxidoreductase [Tropicimonas marinistellae]